MPNGNTRASRLKAHEQGTTVERIWNHIIAPHNAPLTAEEHDYYERLKDIYAIMIEHRARHEQVALIEGLTRVANSTAYRQIADCENLFGRLTNRAFELDRNIHCEQLMAEAQKAKDGGDRITWRFLMADLAEIRGFKRQVSGLQPGDVILPITVWADDEDLINPPQDEPEE